MEYQTMRSNSHNIIMIMIAAVFSIRYQARFKALGPKPSPA